MPRRPCEWPDASEGVLVSYSGGKDSLVVLDLAIERYGASKVEAFFMYFIPGLDYTRIQCATVEDRYGIRVHKVQHWLTSELLRDGVFCDERPDAPNVRIKDIERAVRVWSGKRWIGYGYRADESLERRAMLSREFQGKGVDPVRAAFAPIAYWSTREVRHYIRSHAIPISRVALSADVRGVTTSPASMHWLREHFPSDYARILRVFPYAEGQADRWPTIKAERDAALRVSRSRPKRDHERTV